MTVADLDRLLRAVRALLETYENTPYTFEAAYYALKKNHRDWDELKEAFVACGGQADWEVGDIWG